jgi:hypothetical protein
MYDQEPGDLENSFEIEQSSLDSPNMEGLAQPSPLLKGLRLQQSRRSQRIWESSVALLALLVLLLTIKGSFVFSPSISPAASPPGSNFPCIRDIAWSPRGTYFAVLNYQDSCDKVESEPHAGLLTIFDAASRKIVARSSPDTAILAAITPRTHAYTTPSPTEQSAPLIYYSSLLWSPVMHNLALTFSLELAPQSQQEFNGVLLLNEIGNYQRVLMQPRPLPGGSYTYLEWDLRHDSPDVVLTSPDQQSSALSILFLPPALSYHWGTNGALLPEGTLNDQHANQQAAQTPIGNPQGDPGFSLWQSGVIDEVSSQEGNFPRWWTSFAAWSPDGRYLIDHPVISAEIQTNQKSIPSTHYPLLSVRDPAFAQLVSALTSPNSPKEVILAAWNPDGQLLASFTLELDEREGQKQEQSILLYPCKDGHLLKAFPLAAPIGKNVLLRWSPDGTHLLLADGQNNLVLGPDQLSAFYGK